MLHKKLFFQLILRVGFILANSILLAYLFITKRYPVTQINLLLLLFAQSGFLVFYLNKANRDLSRFFSSITNEDYSIKIQDNISDKSFKRLKQSIENVKDVIEEVKIAQIEHYEYLKNVVSHVGVGILSFDDSEEIDFFNAAGKQILDIQNANYLADIENKFNGFANKIKDLKLNQQKLLTLRAEGKELPLTAKLVEFKLGDRKINLLAFQNIQLELDYKEVVSWQRIIRVLTHEIMNSVSPINSATTTISRLYEENGNPISPERIQDETIQKTLKGMRIIRQRSEGMLEFVDKFRDLTLIPEPRKEATKIQDLFQTIQTLYAEEFQNKDIKLIQNINPLNLTVKIDKAQIEQVLINLVKNSIEALPAEQGGRIDIQAYMYDSNVYITISDNGIGIPDEALGSVFIPFFTTKQSGSGVGLSLSKQIIINHDGNLLIENKDQGCIASIVFPKES